MQIKRFQCGEIQCVVGEEGDLGEGSFGVVRLGFHAVLGPVAVKSVHYKGRNSTKQKDVDR